MPSRHFPFNATENKMKTSEDRSTRRRMGLAAVPVAALLAAVVAFTAPNAAPGEDAPPSNSTLTSLTVSPYLITASGTATGTVRRNTAAGFTVVNLTSANTAVATVPSRITIPRRSSAGSFTVTGTPGEGGCTTVSARTGTDAPVQTKIAVAPSNPRFSTLTLRFGSAGGTADAGFDGATIAGTVTLSSPTPRGVTVALSSSAPRGLDLPASVYIAPGQSSAPVSIKQRVRGNLDCAVVTASLGTAVSKRLVLFWASPEGW